MSDKNKFVYDELPKDAKKLFPERGQWIMYLLIIPILLITLVGFRVRWIYATEMMFSRVWFFVGAVVSLFFVVWMCIPDLDTEISSALFGFALRSLSMYIGDIYNAILAMIKMKSNSVLITFGTNSYSANSFNSKQMASL